MVYWHISSQLFNRIDLPTCLWYRYYWTVPLILDFLLQVSELVSLNITHVHHACLFPGKAPLVLPVITGLHDRFLIRMWDPRWKAQILFILAFVFLIPCRCSGLNKSLINQLIEQSAYWCKHSATLRLCGITLSHAFTYPEGARNRDADDWENQWFLACYWP